MSSETIPETLLAHTNPTGRPVGAGRAVTVAIRGRVATVTASFHSKNSSLQDELKNQPLHSMIPMTAILLHSNRLPFRASSTRRTKQAKDEGKMAFKSLSTSGGEQPPPTGFKLLAASAREAQQHFAVKIQTAQKRLLLKREYQIRVCACIGAVLAIAAVAQLAIYPFISHKNEGQRVQTEMPEELHESIPIGASVTTDPADAPIHVSTSSEVPAAPLSLPIQP